MTIVSPSGAPNVPAKQSASPTEGATVVIAEAGRDIDMWLTPAAPLVALTIQLPVGYDGQNVNIGSSKAIGTLTITGASNIFDAMNTLSPGNSFTLHRFALNNWSHP